MTTLTKEIAIKVRDTVSCGLSKGLGVQEFGKMCIEAAVCFAYGLPHNDNPPCVGSAVRRFKIRLNDSNWSSNEARAKGMIAIAIAQLGSNEIDQKEFGKRVTIKTINSIVADLAKRYLPEIEDQLRAVSDLQEAVNLCKKLKSAAYAAYAAYAAAYAAEAYAAYAAAYAADAYAAYAAAYAAEAADAAAAYAAEAYAAYAAAYAADAYAAYAAAYAAEAADAADAADAAAAYAAYAAEAAAADAADGILVKAANICLEVLKELKSPGCEFLYLLNQ